MENNGIAIETFPVGSLGCNLSLIYSKVTREAIAIDPGNDFEQFMSLIGERKLKVKLLLHTHAHFDHIGRSGEIKNSLGCPIYLHKNDLELYNTLSSQGMMFGIATGEPSKVDNFIEDEESIGIESPGLKNFLKTMHTPGHTPGSCCFYTEEFETPLLFSGDTLFKGSIGRTDFPGGNYDEIMKSLKGRLLPLPEETRVITGHGPETRIFEEKKFNPFLS
ncbi:MAG: MBL fold metallo-hydrolase [Epsilonproteobacteria bacterium]|nr:MAG: MBL fold metallo-hydrolase [Campylobacterota bacterium]RLA63879.1 MAG: MBL fold metallo-hydrolase [Campylobacterota bacterium]